MFGASRESGTKGNEREAGEKEGDSLIDAMTEEGKGIMSGCNLR